MPELHLIAGANGAGKSTFTREVAAGIRQVDYVIPPIIDPDAIARELRPGNPDAAAAPAAREALRKRRDALARRESFSIETTLSGKSERRLIAEAEAAGYRVSMTYIGLASAEEHVARVVTRAEEEGRRVPPADVRRRYARSLDSLRHIASQVDVAYIYDNSGRRCEQVATLRRGRVVALAQDVPAWLERVLPAEINFAREQSQRAQIPASPPIDPEGPERKPGRGRGR